MKKRFAIKVDGSPRTVLSIWENPNNHDLNIHITGRGATYSSDSLKELVMGTEEENYIRSEKHITVHNSPKSKENNVIKRTIEYTDKVPDTSVQVTGAAYSGPFRPPIPGESGHPFRMIPATHSGAIRPPLVLESDS